MIVWQIYNPKCHLKTEAQRVVCCIASHATEAGHVSAKLEQMPVN